MEHKIFIVRGLRKDQDAWVVSMAMDLDGTVDYIFAETTKGSLRTLSYGVPIYDLSEHEELNRDLLKAYQRHLDAVLRRTWGRSKDPGVKHPDPKRLM